MLRAIELSGFKSFADRIRIEFGSGISAIVGPNGSGKSNIVDAVKWVLGEQSMKRLRGNESTDVIFNGSADRAPLGSAEVTLTFDNSQKIFKLDTPEVHITRRIYRSGESEYQINRQQSRLKDIKDILNGTGLGTQAYCIIEQGRVESLIQSSPVQRRVIFDEAAGINRFNAYKQEIQRRHERIDQNLLRLSDIVTETDHKLKTTRNQAGKAQLYREYTTRLKELRIQSAIIDLQKRQNLSANLQAERDAFKKEIDKLTEESEQTEKLLSGVNNDIESADVVMRKFAGEAAALRERILGEESAIELQFTQADDLSSQIVRNWQSLTELNVRSIDIEELMRKTGEDIFKANKAKREVNETYCNLQNEDEELAVLCTKLQAELDVIRLDSDDKSRQSANLSGVVGGLESGISSQHRTIEQNNIRLTKLKQQREELSLQYNELNDAVDNIEDTVNHKKEQLHHTRERKSRRLNELTQLMHDLSEQKQRQSGMRERISVLEDLINKNEGISPGVREVLQQSRDPRSPFRHVFGLVADLLHADVESASLIDLALGQNSQYVVVSPKGELFRHIERNAAQFAGRVGFIWLDPNDEDPPWVKSRGFLGRNGVYGRADQYVKAKEPFMHLARRLLGRTWIVENMAVAVQLYKESNDQASFLTIAGELLTTDGALVVGPPNTSSGLIARRSELRNLTEQMALLDNEVQDIEIAVVVAKERAANDERDVDNESRDYQKAVAGYDSLVQKLSTVEEQLKNNNEQIANVSEEVDKLNTQLASMSDELEQTIETRSKLDAGVDALRLRHDGIREELAKAETKQSEHQQKTMEVKIALAKSEERLVSLNERKRQFEDHLTERQNMLAEYQQRSTMLERKREIILLAILQIESALAGMYLRKESLGNELTKVNENRNEIGSKRTKLQNEYKRLQHDLNKIRTKEHAKQLELERISQEQKTLAGRIREDYDIDVNEIIATKKNDGEVNEIINVTNNIDGTDAASDAGKTDAADIDYKEAIEDLRLKLQRIGSVNLDAIDELDDLETRYNSLSFQYNDMVNAKRSIENAIERINTSSQVLFEETFNGVRHHFIDLFQHLFGGGSADIVLENPSNVLESGIEIIAKPPGKELKSIMLMSGGEKTLTCVALLLAFFRYKPNPVCILDECDAALDEGNVDRFLRTIKEFENETQFIMITHSKKSMSIVSTLHGITMHESGVSTHAGVEFRNVNNNENLKENAAA
ncbi:MAG: chromosome segregation protein SMC [Planctomycetaceae bacterium]|jgi:chromosome segregation protein|nr:chromosome segregation protein SMC [Planctomycetaceae bacterium]